MSDSEIDLVRGLVSVTLPLAIARKLSIVGQAMPARLTLEEQIDMRHATIIPAQCAVCSNEHNFQEISLPAMQAQIDLTRQLERSAIAAYVRMVAATLVSDTRTRQRVRLYQWTTDSPWLNKLSPVVPRRTLAQRKAEYKLDDYAVGRITDPTAYKPGTGYRDRTPDTVSIFNGAQV